MPVRPGGVCPICGVTIDKRAKTCRAHATGHLTADHQRAAIAKRWAKERHMDTLLETIDGLDDTLLSHLSTIIIDEDADGALTATLSIDLYVPGGTTATAGPYAISADLSDPPEGITPTSLVRWQDITKPLANDVDIIEQIQQLQASGLVGDLDASSFEPKGGATLDHPKRRIIIKVQR